MNITHQQSKERRDKLYNYLVSNQKNYGIVHIPLSEISKKLDINRVTINNDIRHFLEQHLIEAFIPEAGIYQIIKNKPKELTKKLNNDLNTLPVNYINSNSSNISTIHDLNFTAEERQALQEFEQHRKDINKPLSPLAYEKMIARAAYLKNKGVDLVKHINYSISGGKDQIYETIYEKAQNNHTQLTFKERDEKNRINQLKQTRETQAAIHNFLNGNDEQSDNKLLGNTNK